MKGMPGKPRQGVEGGCKRRQSRAGRRGREQERGRPWESLIKLGFRQSIGKASTRTHRFDRQRVNCDDAHQHIFRGRDGQRARQLLRRHGDRQGALAQIPTLAKCGFDAPLFVVCLALLPHQLDAVRDPTRRVFALNDHHRGVSTLNAS